MSHFSTIKTNLTNIDFIKEALDDLKINFSVDSETIIINQENGSDIQFNWNGNKYDLVADKQFWQLPISFETFLEKLQTKYNYHNLMKQADTLGFVVNETTEFVNGTKTIILQRF